MQFDMDRPIKVLHVVSELRPKTDTIWLSRLARVWKDTPSIEMHVAWCYGPAVMARQFEAAGVRCWPLEAKSWRHLSAAGRLARLARAIRCDVIHSHLLRADLLAGIVGRSMGLPVVRTAYAIRPYHRQWRRPLLDGLLDVLEVRLPSHILAVSAAVARDCIRRGCSPYRVTVVHTAAPCIEPADAGQIEKVRAELGCSGRDILVLTVARLSREKGIDDLLAAARLILPMAREVPMRFAVLGEGPDRSRLEEQMRRMGLDDVFAFAGWFARPQIAMQACDIFCLPSRMEGLPNALLEAMAVGCAIVATRVGGVPEILEHGRNALLVPAGDPEALAHSLLILARNADLRNRLGRSAKHVAQERLALDKAAKGYEQLYRRLIRCSNGRDRPGNPCGTY